VAPAAIAPILTGWPPRRQQVHSTADKLSVAYRRLLDDMLDDLDDMEVPP
jgi:hypothetical protein